jgi:hypothetical protein
MYPPFNNQEDAPGVLYALEQNDYVLCIARSQKNGPSLLFVFHLRHAACERARRLSR